jgi:hypothetical protein
MSHNLRILTEIDYLFQSATLCNESRSGSDGAWQVAPLNCSIPYRETCLQDLRTLKEKLHKRFPTLLEFGERRAQKAFYQPKSDVTKPSYRARIDDFLKSGHNQLEVAKNIAQKEPFSGGLVFSVFSPEDMIKRQRPGYVPCLVSGSFLVHENQLQINAFFRSQSVVEFGLFDMIFLREFQEEFFDLIKSSHKKLDSLELGSLNVHFARVLVHRRFVKFNDRFIRRDAIFDEWLEVIGQENERIMYGT